MKVGYLFIKLNYGNIFRDAIKLEAVIVYFL